jgi:hypothetical protein
VDLCPWSREASACHSSFLEFRRISDLLISYVMPPRLTAELYRALADIPGVTVDTHAVDAAGRRGVAFAVTAVGETDKIIMNPRTFRLMGTEIVYDASGGYPAQVSGETAILRMALASGPGVRP